MSIAERIADSDDPLRSLLRAARAWQVPPTVFMGHRVGFGWTVADTEYAMALEDYEASLCPGGEHVLVETTRPEHADAYMGGEPIRCHWCKAQALVTESAGQDDDSAGLLVPIILDPAVVALNKLPVPALPPELQT